MIKIFKKWRDEKEKRIAQKISEQEGWLRVCEKDVEITTKEMLMKPCPINGDNRNCSDECVHFKAGMVTHIYDYSGRTPITIYPKCALWK